MASLEEKQNWLEQVLGVTIETTPDFDRPADGPVLPIWVEAKEALDVSLDGLQRALRGSDDEEWREIAEFGLNGITNRESVRLMVALREADQAGSPEARRKAMDAIASFRAFLSGAPIIELIETNPLGVAVPVRDTLDPALARIARSLGG